MTTVVASITMSLDGFVADEDDRPGAIFDWYDTGDVEVHWPGNEMVSRVTPASAAVLRDTIDTAGALVVGRRLFDLTSGWAGSHPLDVPVVVLTHEVPDGWPREDAPFTFVTDGLDRAVDQARRLAGDGTVGVGGPDVVQQCLRAGLVDVLHVDLAPVLLGRGVRLFGDLDDVPVLLSDPVVVEGHRVTHLTYEVSRPTD